MGRLPNDVRTHFTRSNDREKVLLYSLLKNLDEISGEGYVWTK